MGLLKYNSGNILIDDQELSKLNLNSFYDNVTYVSQEAPIFDGTLRENLIFDKKIKDDESLESGRILKNIEGNIEFKNVSYSYNSEKNIIDNLSFKIDANSSP